MREIESGIAEAAVEGIVLVAEFPGSDGSGNFGERFGIKSQGFAHFAGGNAIAIRDDIGRHGGATFAVSLVDILNDFFALVAAREIEIDVGPLAALLREEALKEKFHADGINGGDTQRVADGAVGGGAASLNQDGFLAAVTDPGPED